MIQNDDLIYAIEQMKKKNLELQQYIEAYKNKI